MILNRNTREYSDKELLALIEQTGDVTYIGELFKKYSVMLLGFSMNYLKSEAAAKDAVMDVFEIVLLEIPKGTVKNFRNWLFVVARNYCYKVLREEKQLLDYEEVLGEHESDFVEEDAETLRDKQEAQLAHLETAMGQLKEEHKKCLTLFYYQNKSYKEVAAITGFEVKKVKSYIQNGKRNLGNMIVAIGGGR